MEHIFQPLDKLFADLAQLRRGFAIKERVELSVRLRVTIRVKVGWPT